MTEDIAKAIDNLVPRGGIAPACITVPLEDYLSRLSNLNRKLYGVKHRCQCWNAQCEEHLSQFEKQIGFDVKKLSTKKINKFSYSLRNTQIENEFEALLYSFTNALTSLTRVIACFMNTSNFHSHSRLSKVLKDNSRLAHILETVTKARIDWTDELTQRRDASTHYITLSVVSTIDSTINEGELNQVKTRVGIPKTSQKFLSLWNDEIPTIGGSSTTVLTYENGTQMRELKDKNEQLILRREGTFHTVDETIDGIEYSITITRHFQSYILKILEGLHQVIQNESSR
jgi:hypothetical protein